MVHLSCRARSKQRLWRRCSASCSRARAQNPEERNDFFPSGPEVFQFFFYPLEKYALPVLRHFRVCCLLTRFFSLKLTKAEVPKIFQRNTCFVCAGRTWEQTTIQRVDWPWNFHNNNSSCKTAMINWGMRWSSRVFFSLCCVLRDVCVMIDPHDTHAECRVTRRRRQKETSGRPHFVSFPVI